MMSLFTLVKPVSFLKPCRLTMCRLLEMSTKVAGISSPGQTTEDVAKIRNIGIMAHIDAGKTTTTERILYYSGFSRHLGDVDRGDTVTDYLEEERERGITIQSAAITYLWKKHKINLIDTPGHVDFTVEVERCLRVLDGAVTVLDASAGVEAQTLTVWRQADRYKVPRIIFLNKMDKQGANFNMCLSSIKKQLHVEPLVLHLPVGNERSFCGMFDIVTMEQKIWDSKKCVDGRLYEVEKVNTEESDSTVDIVKKARESLIGQLAEFDETIADYVLSDHNFEDIPVTDIHRAIKNMTLSGKAVVVLCGSARRNIGIQPLMDAIVHYLPSPLDIQHDFIKYYEPNLCALAFKIVHDTHLGALTYVRIYSGCLQSGSSLFNFNLQEIEKVGKHAVFQVYADEYKAIKESGPGNIVCIAGLEKTKMGDTVTTIKGPSKDMIEKYEKDGDGEALSLAGVEVQPPVFMCSIEAPSVSKQVEMEKALEMIQREDPSLKVELDKDTGQMVLAGMGELHLEIVKHRLEKDFKVEAYLGPLQIAYREILGEEVSHSKIMESTIGNTFNRVAISLAVSPNDEVPVFKNVKMTPELEIPHHRVRKAINIGVKSSLNYGPLLHFPLMNVEVVVKELSVERKTSSHFIQAAASQCVQEALKQAQCYLTEPVMAVEVSTSSTYLSSVQADLARRRGDMSNIFEKNGIITVHAKVPLAELVGYSTDLRTITSGNATFTMELDHYERLTPQEQNKVLSKMVF